MARLLRLVIGVIILSGKGVSFAYSEDCVPPTNDPFFRIPSGVFDPSPVNGFGQSPLSLRSAIDFGQLLREGCGSKVDISGLSPDEYTRASYSGITINFFLDLVKKRAEEGLTSPDGFNKQIVEPDAATAMFGSGFGGRDWRERVAAENPTVKDNKSACQLAIEAVKAVACSSERDGRCDIEESYKDRCTQPNDRKKLGLCVISADTYFADCFGKETMTDQVRASMLPACDGESHFCSASLASGDNRHRTALITATHCESDRIGFGLPQHPSACEPWQGGWGPTTASEMKSYDGELQSRIGPTTFLPIADAQLFGKTYLGGVNRLMQIRNEVAALYNRGGESVEHLPSSFPIYSDVLWDRSALCTVVESDDRSLKHTCQSSRGTSGGPLIQSPDADPQLVGINLGAPQAGSGAFNFGGALMRFRDELLR